MEIPYEKTMVEIFRWRIEKSGNDIAHKFEEKETTFNELDSFSNISFRCLTKVNESAPRKTKFSLNSGGPSLHKIPSLNRVALTLLKHWLLYSIKILFSKR